MRILILIRSLLEDLVLNLSISSNLRCPTHRIPATVYEDITSVLILSTEHRITSRARHYHTRAHFFWEIISNPEQAVDIVYINTAAKQGDYLTKSLLSENFKAIRLLVQGW